ncbi:MAG: hypothetical protein NTY07_07975 [Bacteroidia bacterium]|nr:hypothetical protein [Bacteroidia bacterium]
MQEKQTLNDWLKTVLNCTDFDELAKHGHTLLGLKQKTWYNYRMGKTLRIPADVAAKFNRELINRNYQPYEF